MIIASKVLVLPKAGEVEFKDEIIDTESLSSGALVAQTIYSAISPGTEIGAYRGASPLRSGPFFPRVNGYCNIGKVIHVGSDVKNYCLDDYILTLQSHRSHYSLNVAAASGGNDFQVKGDFAYKLEPGIDLRLACTAYLYHLGYHSLLSGDVRAGYHVGIIGLGVLGYTAAEMALAIGAIPYVMSDHVKSAPWKNGKLVNLLSKDELALESINKNTKNTGVDVVINTSNSWADYLLALKIVAKNGTIVNLGFPGRESSIPDFNPLDSQYTYIKNLTIKALNPLYASDIAPHDIRFNLSRNIDYLMYLIKNEILNPKTITTDTIQWCEIQQQYDKYIERASTMYTSLVEWT